MSMNDVAVTATVTAKGQITIPAEIRRLLRLQQGDSVLFQASAQNAETAAIRKVPRWRDLAGSVRVPDEWKDATWEEIREHAHRAVAARYLTERS